MVHASFFFLFFCPWISLGLEAAGELSELQENGREGYFFISFPGVFVPDGSPYVNEGERVSQVGLLRLSQEKKLFLFL